jgi:hypothetical protein
VLTHGLGLRATADEDAAFEVGLHGTAGEVRAADERDMVVHHDDLRVQRRAGRALLSGPVQTERVEAREGRTNRRIGRVVLATFSQQRDCYAARGPVPAYGPRLRGQQGVTIASGAG